ncbi:hypothetical protein OK015_16420 [Mycobacterium sp. Aquia_216]|uniref:hypothetical protein n=1 Tax=Mycobacterium sp. Aquia_216 TaxID=2991729 RepID=UPI00227AF5A5|nr:hypothetical protein [Mycobacterium sp. Aquia_216]WAJ42846.1 hypothetical protein OK015_16420 [Mycobacterium sp. Aquia_216]
MSADRPWGWYAHLPGLADQPPRQVQGPPLTAGIDRRLDRPSAMHDVRIVFAGLGDMDVEPTVLGRYLLTVIDQATRTA